VKEDGKLKHATIRTRPTSSELALLATPAIPAAVTIVCCSDGCGYSCWSGHAESAQLLRIPSSPLKWSPAQPINVRCPSRERLSKYAKSNVANLTRADGNECANELGSVRSLCGYSTVAKCSGYGRTGTTLVYGPISQVKMAEGAIIYDLLIGGHFKRRHILETEYW